MEQLAKGITAASTQKEPSPYVRCYVLFRPFLSEGEEVAEALLGVFGEIFHSQQADGFWVGSAVHQSDSLGILFSKQSH